MCLLEQKKKAGSPTQEVSKEEEEVQLGGSYSTDMLAQLKQSQKYVSIPTTKPVGEKEDEFDVLVGEQAFGSQPAPEGGDREEGHPHRGLPTFSDPSLDDSYLSGDFGGSKVAPRVSAASRRLNGEEEEQEGQEEHRRAMEG